MKKAAPIFIAIVAAVTLPAYANTIGAAQLDAGTGQWTGMIQHLLPWGVASAVLGGIIAHEQIMHFLSKLGSWAIMAIVGVSAVAFIAMFGFNAAAGATLH